MANTPVDQKHKSLRVNISIDPVLHRAATKRAFSQNMSFSAYLALLITRSQQRTKGA